MGSIFAFVLNMSMTGSVVIVLVMLARFILKGFPKIYAYVLWSVVLFRLLCPVSFTAPVSVIGSLRPEVTKTTEATTIVRYLPETEETTIGFVPGNTAVERIPDTDAVKSPDLMEIVSYVWAAGICVMLLHSAVQYVAVRKQLVGSLVYRGDVYLADGIDMPFAMGVLKPRIYLPSNIPLKERKYIIAHERHHIKRGDHITKMLAYIALCIHWFNPLAWIAFILAGKDMEMSCDEAVIRQLGPQIRSEYAATLVRLTKHSRNIAGTPLAFGEGDTKGRVKNMVRWRKPRLWVSVLCIILCAAIVAACGFNPGKKEAVWNGEVSVELPQGYSISQDKKGNTVFTDGSRIIGGKQVYSIPEGYSSSAYVTRAFLEALGIEEASDESNGHYIESSGYCWSAEFFSDVADPKDRTLHRVHRFYEVDNGKAIVDIWIDMMQIDASVKDNIFASVEIPEIGVFWEEASPVETIPVQTSQTVELPFELLPLPEGYSYDVLGSSCVLFVRGTTDIVGGVDLRDIPEGVYDPYDSSWFWLEKMGMSDFENPDLCYMGGMTSGDNGWLAEFASDVPEGTPRTEHRRHIFRVTGDRLCDIWLDMMLLSYEEAEDISSAVRFASNSSPDVSNGEKTPEDMAAFEKTLAVMDAVSGGSCHILGIQENTGNEGPKGYERNYRFHEGNYLYTSQMKTEGENITEAGAYFNRYALLIVGDQWFSNEDHQGEPEIVWSGCEPAQPEAPWLGNRVWNKSFVTYIDTMEDEKGSCYMFRYDKPFSEKPGMDGHYFVNFYFDPHGNFQNVQLQVNLFREDEFTITESIVSMDAETVNDEIQRQYQRAMG